MSKILNVSIVNKNTLVLEEDAKKGDKIDLLSLNNVDLSNIEKRIEEGIDSVYNRKLKEREDALVSANKIAIENTKLEVKTEYSSKITELETKLNNQETVIEAKYLAKIKELETQLQGQKTIIETEYSLKIEQLKQEKESLKRQFDLDKREELSKVINEKDEVIREKDKEISELTRSKYGTNVKRIGERLEHWCENEFEEHSMNGFLNCTFEKDNISVKEEGDTKGTKADYIFKVFADGDKNIELVSVTCEMKSEDPNSVNKKKNSDHYKKLDTDRKKKNTEYALLVSELEWNDDNDVPIRKVKEYEKMYVVRPQYFITFLNIISSLASKYQRVLLEKEKEKEKTLFKETDDIIKSFDEMRDAIIDKQLTRLNKEIEEIKKQCDSIKSAADKISTSTSKITDTIIKDIERKIENFNIVKITKKIDKLEE